jgi:hypothetical protein
LQSNHCKEIIAIKSLNEIIEWNHCKEIIAIKSLQRNHCNQIIAIKSLQSFQVIYKSNHDYVLNINHSQFSRRGLQLSMKIVRTKRAKNRKKKVKLLV